MTLAKKIKLPTIVLKIVDILTPILLVIGIILILFSKHGIRSTDYYVVFLNHVATVAYYGFIFSAVIFTILFWLVSSNVYTGKLFKRLNDINRVFSLFMMYLLLEMVIKYFSVNDQQQSTHSVDLVHIAGLIIYIGLVGVLDTLINSLTSDKKSLS